MFKSQSSKLTNNFKECNKTITYIKYGICIICLLIAFNLVYKKIQDNKINTRIEDFAILTELQDLATNNTQVIINSTNQVKFTNASIGNYFTGDQANGNTLTDIFNDVYTKINTNAINIATLTTTANTANATANTANAVAFTANATANSSYTAITDAANSSIFTNILPVGSIIIWTNTVLPNNKWVVCDGGSVYTDPVDNISKKVPDLRGRFVLGCSTTSSALAPVNGLNDPRAKTVTDTSKIPMTKSTDTLTYDSHGSALVELYSVNMPKHQHEYQIFGADTWAHPEIGMFSNNAQSGFNVGISPNSWYPVYQSSYKSSPAGGNPNGGDKGYPFLTLPPYYALVYIIKIK